MRPFQRMRNVGSRRRKDTWIKRHDGVQGSLFLCIHRLDLGCQLAAFPARGYRVFLNMTFFIFLSMGFNETNE